MFGMQDLECRIWNAGFGIQGLECIVRIIIAVVFGVLIGYKRQKRSMMAGVRTHCVVACTSALMMILSKYAYLDVMEMYGDLMKIDPFRIASGVVSGIGFLGACMIFVHKNDNRILETEQREEKDGNAVYNITAVLPQEKTAVKKSVNNGHIKGDTDSFLFGERNAVQVVRKEWETTKMFGFTQNILWKTLWNMCVVIVM